MVTNPLSKVKACLKLKTEEYQNIPQFWLECIRGMSYSRLNKEKCLYGDSVEY